MDFKQISIDDKPLFDRYFALRYCQASDFTFTNLFLWRLSRTIEYAMIDDFLCIRTTYPDADPFMFIPFGVGDVKGVMEKLIADFDHHHTPFAMRSLTNDMMYELGQALPGVLFFTPMRDRFDYVYLVRDMIELHGRKLHGKRNHINQFRQTHDFSYEPLTPAILDEVAEAEVDWCLRANCEEREGLANERRGILNALDHYEALKFQGAVLRIAGKIIAFTFGEALNDDTVVIHIEKADPDIRGAYQMINQQFLENRFSEFTYVNREEDLGIEALRSAKMSYRPKRMIEKYSARIA